MTGAEQDRIIEETLGVSGGVRAIIVIDTDEGVRIVKYPHDLHEVDVLGLAGFVTAHACDDTSEFDQANDEIEADEEPKPDEEGDPNE